MALVRRFLLTGTRGYPVHVRVLGAGPPLLLLHERPNDGTSLLKLAGELADDYTVVVPDLAGHGASGAPANTIADLDEHARDLECVLMHLGINGCGIYTMGNAALLGKNMAWRQPGMVDRLFIHDETPWQTDQLQDSFAPEPSGAHLLRLWDSVRMRAQFLPDAKPSLSNRLARGMPSADELHKTAVAYLKADPRTVDGHAGAAERTPCSSSRPVGIIRIASATLGGDASDGEAHIVSADETPRAIIRSAGVAGRFRASGASPRDVEPRRGLARKLVRIGGGYLHVWMSTEGRKRPVLVLHDPAGSARLVLPFVSALAEDRPIIVPDLPGNGESEWVGMTGAVSSSGYAAVLSDLLQALGVNEVDVIGRYSGGPIGIELAQSSPGLVAHLVIAAIAFYDRPDRIPHAKELVERYTPSVQPKPDGSHLALAWHIMKSQALYWPWYRQDTGGCIRGEPQLDPNVIHRRVVDLAICGDRYQAAYAALWSYSMRAKLPMLRVPTLICAPAWDPLYRDLADAASVAPQVAAATLPDRAADWHHVFRAFFDKGPGSWSAAG